MPLIIMHMQEEYPAVRFEPLVAAVEWELVRAIARGDEIVIAECSGWGATLPRLMRHLKGITPYQRFEKAIHLGMDASAAVIEVCGNKGFDQSRFRVCGILTFHCVAATVQGLARMVRGCAIEVVDEATVDKVIGWGMFPEVPNTVLVSQQPGRRAESLGPDRTYIPRFRW
jgi:hypothetical protein